MNQIRAIREEDNAEMAEIVRKNLEKYHLNIPGTAYFDPELEHLSRYYEENPAKRAYFVMEDESGKVIGGIGIAEFLGFEKCAEIQKLYLVDEAKGKGLGRMLLEKAESYAQKLGYRQLYLETHTNLDAAIRLYERKGFHLIEKPDCVLHGTMNRFYMKQIQ